MLDVDHDGDLDVLAGGPGAAGSPGTLQLFRNNGEGALTDITAAAKLQSTATALALAPTDFDNRRDIDVLVLNEGRAPTLFQNQRDGSFRDVGQGVGLGIVDRGRRRRRPAISTRMAIPISLRRRVRRVPMSRSAMAAAGSPSRRALKARRD